MKIKVKKIFLIYLMVGLTLNFNVYGYEFGEGEGDKLEEVVGEGQWYAPSTMEDFNMSKGSITVNFGGFAGFNNNMNLKGGTITINSGGKMTANKTMNIYGGTMKVDGSGNIDFSEEKDDIAGLINGMEFLYIFGGVLDTKGTVGVKGIIESKGGTINIGRGSFLSSETDKVVFGGDSVVNINNYNRIKSSKGVDIKDTATVNLVDSTTIFDIVEQVDFTGGEINMNNSLLMIGGDETNKLVDLNISKDATINITGGNYTINSDISYPTSESADNWGNAIVAKNVNLEGTLNIKEGTGLSIYNETTSTTNSSEKTQHFTEKGNINNNGSIDVGGTLNSNILGNGSIKLSGSNSHLNGDVSGTDNLILSGANSVLDGEISNAGDIELSGSKATINGDVSSANITLSGDNSSIVGNISSTGDIELSGKSSNINGDVAQSGNGKNIKLLGAGSSINGAVLTSDGDIILSGDISSIKSNILNSKNIELGTSSTINGDITQSDNIKLIGDKSNITGNIENSKNIELSGLGSSINGNIKKANEIKLLGENSIITGDIEYSDSIKLQGKGSVIKADNIVSNGDIILSGDNSNITGIIDSNGNIELSGIGSGISGDIKKSGDIKLLGDNSSIDIANNLNNLNIDLTGSNSSIKTTDINGGKVEISGSGASIQADILNAIVNLNGADSVINGNVSGGNIGISGSNSAITGDVSDTDIELYSSDSVFNGNVSNVNINFRNDVILENTFKGNLSSIKTVNVFKNLDIGAKNFSSTSFNVGDNGSLILKVNGINEYGKITANNISISNIGTKISFVVGRGIINKGESAEFKILDSTNLVGSFTEIINNNLYDIVYNGDGVYKIEYKADDGDGDNDDKNYGEKYPDVKDALFDDYDPDKPTDPEFEKVLDHLDILAQVDGDEFDYAVGALIPVSFPVNRIYIRDLNAQLFNIIENHMDKNNEKYNNEETTDVDIWTQTYFNKGKYDRDEYNIINGFKTNSLGFAVGGDWRLPKSSKLGFGLSYTKTDIEMTGRDVDVDNFSSFLYGEKVLNDLYVNGALTYTHGSYEENKDLLGMNIKANYNTESVGMQILGGYNTEFGFSPEIGIRYNWLYQGAYTDKAKQKVDDGTSSMVMGLFGIRYTDVFYIGAFNYIPEIRLTSTYDLDNKDEDMKVILPNGAMYKVSAKNFKESKFGFEIGAKIGLEINNFEFSLQYKGYLKGDFTGHNGLLDFRYNF